MHHPEVSRRTVLKSGGAALAGLSVWQVAGPAQAFPGHGSTDDDGYVPWSVDPSCEFPGDPNDDVLGWLDQPEAIPPPAAEVVGNLLEWEALSSRLTPNENFFTVKHYGNPQNVEQDYVLSVDGMVAHPSTLSLDDLKARPRREVEFTLECSGNTGLPFFIGGIGNARWAGAQLGPLLRESGVLEEGTEVIFWGADSGEVTIRDNPGVTGGGLTGVVAAEPGGGLTVTERFARSMSLEDAMASPNLLCYEMNGDPLPPEHGAPVRLIAPGWYGVANVKWLTNIEVIDRPYVGRFMARDYVTFRERTVGDETVWTFTTVGQALLKSAPARVTRHDTNFTITGAAWGAPIGAVEVSIDGGPWIAAQLCGSPGEGSNGFAWRFWTFDWTSPSSEEHTIASRAIDTNGNVQPAPTDPSIATKHTYWESNGQITRRVLIP